jgi:hypothetical protein
VQPAPFSWNDKIVPTYKAGATFDFMIFYQFLHFGVVSVVCVQVHLLDLAHQRITRVGTVQPVPFSWNDKIVPTYKAGATFDFMIFLPVFTLRCGFRSMRSGTSA